MKICMGTDRLKEFISAIPVESTAEESNSNDCRGKYRKFVQDAEQYDDFDSCCSKKNIELHW